MHEIKHEEIKKKGSFFVEADGKRLAELEYFHSAPNEITIYHTEVDRQLGGQGVGGKLVAAAVNYARENAFKVVPTCAYAKKIIDTTPEFQDVLK